ncbi:unnamed protein product [Prunus armeniaca]
MDDLDGSQVGLGVDLRWDESGCIVVLGLRVDVLEKHFLPLLFPLHLPSPPSLTSLIPQVVNQGKLVSDQMAEVVEGNERMGWTMGNRAISITPSPGVGVEFAFRSLLV